MSADEPIATDEAPAADEQRPGRRTQQFRRANPKTALTADQKRRQAAVTDAAWRAYKSRDAMIAFLNTDDAQLGGRPLDLAVDSDDGLDAILVRLRESVSAAAG